MDIRPLPGKLREAAFHAYSIKQKSLLAVICGSLRKLGRSPKGLHADRESIVATSSANTAKDKTLRFIPLPPLLFFYGCTKYPAKLSTD